MPIPQNLTGTEWRKSSRSKDADTCVEVACNLSDVIGVRDSTAPGGPVLMLGRPAFHALVAEIRAGIHDLQHRP
jgi:hypothetical protein